MFHPSAGAVDVPVALIPPVVFHFRGCSDCTSVGGTTAIPKETKPYRSHANYSHSYAEFHVKDIVSQRTCPPSPRSRALIYFLPVRVGFGGWPITDTRFSQAVL